MGVTLSTQQKQRDSDSLLLKIKSLQ